MDVFMRLTNQLISGGGAILCILNSPRCFIMFHHVLSCFIMLYHDLSCFIMLSIYFKHHEYGDEIDITEVNDQFGDFLDWGGIPIEQLVKGRRRVLNTAQLSLTRNTQLLVNDPSERHFDRQARKYSYGVQSRKIEDIMMIQYFSARLVVKYWVV